MGKEYYHGELKARAEIIGERLCIFVGGKDDMEIFTCPDGHYEVAFFTPLDNIEEMANTILKRVKEVREYRSKHFENKGNTKC